MLWRLVARSMQQRAGQTALILLTVTLGAALAGALLGVAFQVRERMATELRAFGANILVVPRSEPLEVAVGSLRYVAAQEAAYLEESDLPALKTIFWRHNIVAIAPFVSGTVEVGGREALLVGTWFRKAVRIPEGPRQFAFAAGGRRDVPAADGQWTTGVRTLAPSWRVDGAWVEDGSGGAVVGRALASRLGLRPGDEVVARAGTRSARFTVRGILQTGGIEEDQILVELARAQALFGLPGKVEKVQVSALLTPDNALAARARKAGPERLSPEDYETWYCTPYLDAVLYQIEESLPGARAKAVRQVSEAEAAFLGKVTLVFALVSAVGLAAATLGAGATMARTVFERRREVGLMKALGADPRAIALLFLLEAGIAGLGGGSLGALAGTALARAVGVAVFATPIAPHLLLVPAILVVAVGIALLGIALPLRHALRIEPAMTLRED